MVWLPIPSVPPARYKSYIISVEAFLIELHNAVLPGVVAWTLAHMCAAYASTTCHNHSLLHTVHRHKWTAQSHMDGMAWESIILYINEAEQSELFCQIACVRKYTCVKCHLLGAVHFAAWGLEPQNHKHIIKYNYVKCLVFFFTRCHCYQTNRYLIECVRCARTERVWCV